jgi:hypothetical protein
MAMPTESQHAHRSFSTLIGDLEEGQLHGDLTRAVQEIVAELHNARIESGGEPKASLGVVLNFAFDGDTITVTGTVKTTLPKRRRMRSVFYATEENHLTRRNPRQRDLPFKDVTIPAGAAKAL